jgi:predicted metalloprotease with PDZ domain
MRSAQLLGLLALVGTRTIAGQARALPASSISAPISNVHYDLTFNAATAAGRTVHLDMSFDVASLAPVLLSLPVWTPGAYEVTYFPRFVSRFSPASVGNELKWDKVDFATWRISPARAGRVKVSFDFLADQFDNAKAWSTSDFLFVNGTNVFMYPKGRSLNFPATVTVHTDRGWLVATSMHPVTGRPMTYTERNYHDLVDMPFFVGRFDLDSAQIAGRWTRLATYPAGKLTQPNRSRYWDQIGKIIPVQSAVMGETPWDSYSILIVIAPGFLGGSALEHQSSHLSLYGTSLLLTPPMASVTAHEIFHAWNVKRLRPADLVPYRYENPQPTPWLWVSEGITDYYADLTMVRSRIAADSEFFDTTNGKIAQIAGVPPVALEDASLDAWISPVDGTGGIYYPKGSLAGLMLDILIRDATNNRKSLDDVMRELYRTTYKTRFRGFTASDWWGAIKRAAGDRPFEEFNRKYVDGRDPYPWSSVLPLAGLRLVADSQRVARMGASLVPDSTGITRVTSVATTGALAAAGVQPGDILVSVAGETVAAGDDVGAKFRRKMAGKPEGTPYPVVVRRGEQEMTLTPILKFAIMPYSVRASADASEKAVRVRNGILRGNTN